MTQLERSVEVLSQQLMMLQLSQEEMRRSDGDSGIKQVCVYTITGSHQILHCANFGNCCSTFNVFMDVFANTIYNNLPKGSLVFVTSVILSRDLCD